ncbi:MAG TPA: HEAT repeat domain-containing protein [Longimicrobiales bacterium]
MRLSLITIVAGATLFAPAAAAAQSLAERVEAAPADASVRFTFESKPGVCGDGEHIRVRRPGDEDAMTITDGRREYRVRNGRVSSEWDMRECTEGPVEMTLTRDDGRITSARMRVGGTPRTADVELGSATAPAAIEFLLSENVLSRASDRAADHMIFATTLANADSWPGLLRVARAQQIASGPRRAAVFWLAQAAGDRATEGLRSIIGDDSDELEVRKQAVFAISQIRSDSAIDTLIDIARTNREPEIRRNAIFWLGQSGSPRAIAFFEEVLRG